MSAAGLLSRSTSRRHGNAATSSPSSSDGQSISDQSQVPPVSLYGQGHCTSLVQPQSPNTQTNLQVPVASVDVGHVSSNITYVAIIYSGPVVEAGG